MKYKHLLSPGSIASLSLKNRIVLAPMGSNFARSDGHCGERLQAYYEERARGGVGLLILETAAITWPAGATMPNTIGFSSDEFLPGLSQLADKVHQHGAKIAAQLNHGGKMAQEDTAAGRALLVPSPVSKTMSDMFSLLTQKEIAHFIKSAGPDGKGPRYQPMDQQDIEQLIQGFASAAARAQKAGFDAIEIHAGHGYVLASFLSPAINKREDSYGGCLENRARLLTEVIIAVREAVGPGFPILVRLDAMEFRVAGGITLEDAVSTAKLAQQAGADAIDVSAYGSVAKGISFTEAPLVHQPGGYLTFAKTIKKAVNIPVIAVGRVELDMAENGLRSGDFDFVAMGRKLLADPELPNKLAEGRTDSIRPCIYCYVCVSKIFINQPMCCAVNPATGREQQLQIIQSSKPKRKILIIGGGPGGLEAARVLSLCGHQVSLWEKESQLGGTARIAALAYEPNGRLVKYLLDAVRELPVDIKLNHTATLESVIAQAPDNVIVATGAIRKAPDIKGKELRHVFDGDQLRGVLFGDNRAAIKKLSLFQRLVLRIGRSSGLLNNISALRFLSKIWMPMARHIVIIGGDLVGLELAEYLAERGRLVTVLEASPSLGAALSIVRRARVVHILREQGVELVTQANVSEITADAVIYEHEGESKQVRAQQVLIASGAMVDNSLADKLKAGNIAVSCVGDCHQIAYIEGAILDAHKTALAIDQAD
jgi:2,4-dienoyl-CoA reductase (NADPH2)